MMLLKVLIVSLIFIWNECNAGGGGGSRYVNTGSYNGPKKKNSSIYDPLLDEIFEGYNPLAMPICKPGKPLNLMIDMWLYQLFDLDEPKQELTMDVWIDMNWKDCSISWDPKKYNGIEQLTLPSHDVWFPDIFAYQGLHGNYEEGLWVFRESKVKITHDGMVQLGAQLLLRTFCRVNIKEYPYDSQECPVTFSAWNKDLTSFNMTMKPKHDDPTGHSFSRASNGEWTVDSLTAKDAKKKFHVGLNEEIEEEYSEVTFTLKLTRKPKFVEIYLVFPCTLLIWIAAIAFMLPVSSGEKIGLVSTVLLSLVVFLLVVADNVPHTSDNIPLVANFFFVCISLVSFAMVLTTLVLNISHKSPSIKMPHCLKRLVNSTFAEFLCIRKEKKCPSRTNTTNLSINQKSNDNCSDHAEKDVMIPTNGKEMAAAIQQGSTNMDKRSPSLRSTTKRDVHHDKPKPNDWEKFGLLIDRFSLWFYLMMCLFITAYMITIGVLRIK